MSYECICTGDWPLDPYQVPKVPRNRAERRAAMKRGWVPNLPPMHSPECAAHNDPRRDEVVVVVDQQP